MKMIIRNFIITYLISSSIILAGTESSFHLGNRWQVRNNLLDLLGGSQALSKKINEMIMANPEHFGGACDLYELTFYNENDFLSEELNRVRLTYQVNRNKHDVKCRDENDLTIPNFAKGVARNAIATAFCYEVLDTNEDSYGTISYLKSIMCQGECGNKINMTHVKRLYDHFYFYRKNKKAQIGPIEEWGIDPNNVDESVKVLGIAFCSDPNWTHF